MQLVVDKAVWRFLEARHKPYASRSLSELVKKAASGDAIPRTWLKRSGEGKSGRVFQPYLDLRLWHAKLDHGGQHHGDPLLVFQEEEPGVAKAIAIAEHDTFVPADHSSCRRWLWAHKEDINWHVAPAAEAIRADLEREFGHGPDAGL